MNRTFLGQNQIIDFLISQAEDTQPDISQSKIKELQTFFTSFFSNRISFDFLLKKSIELINTESPINILRDIMNISVEKQLLKSENSEDCYPDSPNQSNSTIRRKARPWNQDEDKRLLAGILHFGTDNWSSVSALVGFNRSRAQCSQRWFRGLDPRISKKRWTPEDNEKLLELVNEFGETAWAKIASSMGNRSDVQCRYHFQQLKKNNQKTSNSTEIRTQVSQKLPLEIPLLKSSSYNSVSNQNISSHKSTPLLPPLNLFKSLPSLENNLSIHPLDLFLKHFN